MAYNEKKFTKNLKQGIALAKEFDQVREMAELNALSKYSLEHPLNDAQYKRMMELKKRIFGL